MDQLRRLWERLTGKQRVWIAAAVFAIVGGLSMFSRWNQERDFEPLFTNLASDDASALITNLKETDVEYRLADSGATVLIHAGQIPEVRLALAAQGLPKSGRIGFELFDKTNFGASDFTEQVNYRRAVEGELERSIRAIREVAEARVHVTWAKESLYRESRQPAKASVLLKLKSGVKLSAQNTAAIAQLLASAVPELAAEQVAVLDTNGTLLNRPRRISPGDEGGEVALEYRKSVERDLQAKIAATLEPLLGAEHFRAGASVEVDLTSGDQSEEVFDPEKSALSTSQRSEDGPAIPVASGVPGTASNLPRPTSQPIAGSTNYARKTESSSYQTSRLVRHTKLPQGAIKKVSLSVLVDHNLRWEGTKKIVERPSDDRLKVIRELVSAAAGLDPNRGDQIVVEALPFESTLAAEPLAAAPAAPESSLPLPAWLQKYLQNKNILLTGGIAALALLALFGLPAMLWLRRRGKPKVSAETAAKSLSSSHASTAPADASKEKVLNPEQLQRQMEAKLAAQAALAAQNEAEELLKLKLPGVTTKKTEVLTKHISEEAKKDPSLMAQVVRSWLNDSR